MQTERLCIRPFAEKDAEAYFRLLANPRAHCFASEKAETLQQVRDKIAAQQNCADGTSFAVCLKETDAFIGTLFGIWEEDTFSVCWNFLPKYGKMGYAFEAAKTYLDFLFHQKGARRIYAYVEADNTASQNLCRKLGMRQEGLFLEFISFVQNPDGTPLYENTMQFAILKREWDARSEADILLI